MPTEFDLIFDDFSAELDALAELAATSTSIGTPGPAPRVRVAAGNRATLLLAAMFEEFIRQQVKAAFREKARQATGMSDFPPKIASTVWRRSLEALARTPFAEVEADVRSVDAKVAATLSFCLRKDVAADITDTISHNEMNMRTSQLTSLFNAIGIQSVCDGACSDAELIEHLGSDSPGRAASTLRSEIDDFFRRRNDIAHALKLGISSGPLELQKDIELFRAFGKALTRKLNGAV